MPMSTHSHKSRFTELETGRLGSEIGNFRSSRFLISRKKCSKVFNYSRLVILCAEAGPGLVSGNARESLHVSVAFEQKKKIRLRHCWLNWNLLTIAIVVLVVVSSSMTSKRASSLLDNLA